jgi:hypothetical protein
MMDGGEIRFFSALQPAMNCAVQFHSFIFLVNDNVYVLLFLTTVKLLPFPGFYM